MVYRLKILGRGRSWDRVLRGYSGGGVQRDGWVFKHREPSAGLVHRVVTTP